MPLHEWHHHQEFARNGQIARERRAFGPDAFLENLNENLLAAPQALLDRRSFLSRGFAADLLGRLFGRAVEVLRMQVGDVQKTVALETEIDERRLDGRFDVGHASAVDVADVQVGTESFGVEFFETVVFNDRDPAFFAGHVIDQHVAFGQGIPFVSGRSGPPGLENSGRSGGLVFRGGGARSGEGRAGHLRCFVVRGRSSRTRSCGT